MGRRRVFMKLKRQIFNVAGVLMVLVAAGARGQAPATVADPVGLLGRQVSEGRVRLEPRGDWGYVQDIMERLDLNADSQVLVLAKNSLQARLISPEKPRALYFNDDVMMGIVQDSGLLEFTSLDPSEGLLFYTLEQLPVTDDTIETLPVEVTGEGWVATPRFARRSDCGTCHGPVNRYAAGLILPTVFPEPTGRSRHVGDGIFTLTDHLTPIEERWGGFYVTGVHGSMAHRGNAVARDPDRPFELDTAGSGNVMSLEDRFDVSKYLEPTSDIVALMTLGHQVGMINRMNSVAAQFRASETFPLPAEELAAQVEDLVSYMLFAGEAGLEGPVAGVSTFRETFTARGPFDGRGRSLREFDLETRLFRYPLSYMIYSARFDGLPTAALDQIYGRLFDVLTGTATDGRYRELDVERRRELMEILVETKSGLPPYFDGAEVH